MKTKLLIGHIALYVALILQVITNVRIDYPPPVYAEVLTTQPMPQLSVPPPDPRNARLTKYFHDHDCPLEPLAQQFITAADKYHIDWRLLPAISVKESSCGNIFIKTTYNPFGWGSGTKYFDSFEQAIDYISSALGGNNPNEHAYNKARGDSESILWIYNGTVNSSYAAAVFGIMDSI